MAITVEIPHAISRYSEEETQVFLEGQTVGEVLGRLWEKYPALKTRVLDREGRLYAYLLLFQNDQKLPRENLMNHPLQDGDRLEIVALAEGG